MEGAGGLYPDYGNDPSASVETSMDRQSRHSFQNSSLDLLLHFPHAPFCIHGPMRFLFWVKTAVPAEKIKTTSG